MTCVNHWVVGLALVATGLAAQETPRPNRVAWFEGFPEPLPQGVTEVALEATSQMLRPDLERSADRRTFARLDGEEWQFLGDWATQAGPGRFNVRVRVASRSGGMADQAMVSWHTLFRLPQGGRLDAPKNRLAYHLERDGRVIGELYKPGVALMDLDLAWVLPFGTREAGGRVGASVQLPTGKQADFSGTGGTDSLAGAAVWKQFGSWRLGAQVERVVLGLPKDSPLRLVMDRTAFSRAWGTLGWVGQGNGLISGLGVEVSLAYAGSPYQVGLSRLDRSAWQQHWTFRHTRLPRWRFGFSEEAGTFVAPDVTGFVAYTFGDR
ncbi:MAG: DUF3187 family protein [Holophagaceae bacterium]